MRDENLLKENPGTATQPYVELPGPWYNYEATGNTLDSQDSRHWLGDLDRHERLASASLA